MKKKFIPVNTKKSLASQEEEILHFWVEEQIFEQSIGTAGPDAEKIVQRPLFSFYDGPPFATGLPHYGHLLAGTIKDVIPRYKTMKGYKVPRRFGWDCHGLPIENEIEKAQGLSGAKSIEEFGIPEFNEECRRIVLRYAEEWKSIVARFGRWVDFSNTYKTMDTPFMESVWWVFSELYKKGLVYKGYKVMPFSTKLGTPLSNFEASENYKDVQDPSIVVKISLRSQKNRSLLIWTTTPWTLVSNLAVVVGPDIEYVVVQSLEDGQEYIIAKERVGFVFRDPLKIKVIEVMKGEALKGLLYQPLFPYFQHLQDQNAFRVVVDPFVQLADGTGLVHAAPGFGEDDFYVCQKASIPIVCPVDQNGAYTDEVRDFKGRYVKDCDKEIIKLLKSDERILLHETLLHRYPFCWRSDTPLIYKAVSTWFVHVEKVKETMLEANATISWMPEHIKYGRFGKWLENARDWAISRNRYWGTPIPIWEADDGDRIVIGSIDELFEKTGHRADDLHRHYIDALEITQNGKVYRRISEVFDCWFESGSMPYAQNHYPFENKGLFETNFPADFIAEGLDQTRGWFYTLIVLSSALFGKAPFKNVIVNGIILAEDGAKMSKRLKNYPDPMDVVHKYGADAVRLYMLSSPAVRADDLCFSEAGVELVVRQILIPLFNAYSFYVTYAEMYNFVPDEIDLSDFIPSSELDRWILSKSGTLVANVEKAFEKYDLQTAVQQFQPFVDILTNWYIRRSRRRFWSDQDTLDRREAFYVLHTVLKTLALTMAPCVPFLSEIIWKNLRSDTDPISIHLAAFPDSTKFVQDLLLERAHALAQNVVQLAHALRKELQIRVRQPLKTLYVITSDPVAKSAIESVQAIILDEINVKSLVIQSDEHEFVHIKAKPNFRVLGKKVGKKMKAVQEAVEAIGFDDLIQFMDRGESGVLVLLVDGEKITLTQEDVVIEREVKEGIVAHHEAGLTVALDSLLSPELLSEGLAREIVNKINTMRRDLELKVSDRIDVGMNMSQKSAEGLQVWQAFIQEETLAILFSFEKPLEQGFSQEWELQGEMVSISIKKHQAH